jgi:Transposase DDE domain
VAVTRQISFDGVHRVLKGLYNDCLHAKRIVSLAGAALGAMQSASLAVTLIGQGLALARGLNTKYAIKQVDRLLSNDGIDVDALLAHWVPFVAGDRREITVALDWTDFDADGQTTLMLSLLTRHGRSTPLYWLTVDAKTLKGRRNAYEYQVLVRFAAALPATVKVTVVADRGFCDHKLYRVLHDELKVSFVIRMRANIMVTANGERRKAADWVGPGGRACCTAPPSPASTIRSAPWCACTPRA